MSEKPATKPQDGKRCDPDCPDDAPTGPVREAGGTTGAGNLSEASANRTGGATSGTPRAKSQAPANKLPPSA
jgi:hypothetical protein